MPLFSPNKQLFTTCQHNSLNTVNGVDDYASIYKSVPEEVKGVRNKAKHVGLVHFEGGEPQPPS